MEGPTGVLDRFEKTLKATQITSEQLQLIEDAIRTPLPQQQDDSHVLAYTVPYDATSEGAAVKEDRRFGNTVPGDVEAVGATYKLRDEIPWLVMLFDQGAVTRTIVQHEYEGRGTPEDPHVVRFLGLIDPRDPLNWSSATRWLMCVPVMLVTLSVNFLSSAYSAGIPQIQAELGGSSTIHLLGVSLFVLGFAFGPFVFAPLSEIYGRQRLLISTYIVHTVFNIGTCFAPSLTSLLVLRFFSGTFGSAPSTACGGVIADSFPAGKRSLALQIFTLGPLLGPILGPIVGGFVVTRVGWRWLMGMMALFTGVLLIISLFTLPETYAPVLLKKRAARLSKLTGRVYRAQGDLSHEAGHRTAQTFSQVLFRPWLLFVREPIVLLLSLYQSIALAIIYLMFAAFPIVYAQTRGWSQESTGLAFLGIGVGELLGWLIAAWDDRRRSKKRSPSDSGFMSPEERLSLSRFGSLAIPIGLFWFAWTNGPEVHYIVSILAGIPLGTGLVIIMIGIQNYLIDAYTLYAASVLAGGVFMRSLVAAVFTFVTPDMYEALGIHWGASIPAFLSLACLPLPILLYRYGAAIRARCKYAIEAAAALQKLRHQASDSSFASTKPLRPQRPPRPPMATTMIDRRLTV